MLSHADRAMLDYVAKLTLTPGEVHEEDVAALREVGFSDQAIGDIALNAALFALFNRIVDGLGGELARWMPAEAERLGLPLQPGHEVFTRERLSPAPSGKSG